MSHGGRDRASLGVEACNSSKVERAAVRRSLHRMVRPKTCHPRKGSASSEFSHHRRQIPSAYESREMRGKTGGHVNRRDIPTDMLLLCAARRLWMARSASVCPGPGAGSNDEWRETLPGPMWRPGMRKRSRDRPWRPLRARELRA